MAQASRSLIVVRRGEAEILERLRAELAGEAEVIPDRRIRDRRVIIQDVAIERRRGERRAPLDATQWATHGYIVVRPQRAVHDAAHSGARRTSRPGS
jgi:hypothetical protein